MRFVYNDGGRAAAGFKGVTGDCVIRAIAIADRRPYIEVYEEVKAFVHAERRKGRILRGHNTPRDGVYTKTLRRYMRAAGWVWTPLMGIGTGCHYHLRSSELPRGRIVVSLSKHVAAVVNGVLHDIGDCSRNGTRCVYGYWIKP